MYVFYAKMFELARNAHVSNKPNTCDGKTMCQSKWWIHVGSSVIFVYFAIELFDWLIDGNVIFL